MGAGYFPRPPRNMPPGDFHRKINQKINRTKEIPSCLIPHLLVVFTQQLEILVTFLPRWWLRVQEFPQYYVVCAREPVSRENVIVVMILLQVLAKIILHVIATTLVIKCLTEVLSFWDWEGLTPFNKNNSSNLSGKKKEVKWSFLGYLFLRMCEKTFS